MWGHESSHIGEVGEEHLSDEIGVVGNGFDFSLGVKRGDAVFDVLLKLLMRWVVLHIHGASSYKYNKYNKLENATFLKIIS